MSDAVSQVRTRNALGSATVVGRMAPVGNEIGTLGLSYSQEPIQTVSFIAQVLNGTPDGTVIHDAAVLSYPGGSISKGNDLVVHR